MKNMTEHFTEFPVDETQPRITEPAVEVVSTDEGSPSAPALIAPEIVYSKTTHVNVIDVFVEENTLRYMDMLGVCKCPRCVADVKAYALNHLTPKYVVVDAGESIPRITLYEHQFSTAVTTQLLNACNVVKNSPHHGRT